MGTDTQVEKDLSIIFFDGVCNLCNSSVNFVIDHDKGHYFHFASLQSDYSIEKLSEFVVPANKLDSIVLLDGGKIYTKSTAVLKIAGQLGGGWSLFRVFLIIPKPVRDFFYDLIAKNRYNWFGKRDSCRVPTPELKERFLDSYDVS